MSTTYTVSGTVRYPDGIPAVEVTAMVVDVDSGPDDPFGAMQVRPDGSFDLSAAQEEVGGHQEGIPDVRLYLFRDSTLIHDEWIDVEDDPRVTVEITVDRPTTVSMDDVMDTMCDMHHGMSEQRGMTNVSRAPFHPEQGRFGRMFGICST